MRSFANFSEAIEMPDNDWIDLLHKHEHNDRFRVHNTDAPWFELIKKRYPVWTSGIRWDDTPGSVSKYADPPGMCLSERIAEVRDFLREFGIASGLAHSGECVVIGDIATNMALQIPFADLLELFPTLFSEPQGTYVCTPDCGWCFGFTFEEDMHYAPALA